MEILGLGVTVADFLSKQSGKIASWRFLRSAFLALSLITVIGVAQAGKAPPYTYSAVGDAAVVPSVSSVQPYPSYVLMGGGPDVDEAFRWMIKQAGIRPGTGGRLVVIRATGDGAYNPYIYYSSAASSTGSADIVDGWVGGASLGLTSVETLVIPSIAAANDTFVNAVLGRANAVWIAGGDQSDYIKFWKGQTLEKTLGTLMKNNVPIGGTSAGLAVLGQFDYAALNGTVTSAQAMSNPYNKYMTLDPAPLSTSGGFIAPPALANTILDSHLDARDRMGRLITFVSRLVANYPGSGSQQLGCTGGVLGNNAARGIGVSVESALLVNWDPVNAHYVGRRVTNNPAPTTEAAVYFVNVTQGPTLCTSGKPLAVGASAVQIRKLADSTTSINLSDWSTFPIYRSVGVNAGVLSPDPY
jgi:cyanophycinase-like exopeptidase